MSPVSKGLLIANKKIVFVEYPKYTGSQWFNEDQSGLFQQVVQNFRSTLRKYHILQCFILDGGQDDLHPLTGPDDSEVHFLSQVSVLEYLEAEFAQPLETPQSIYFLYLHKITSF